MNETPPPNRAPAGLTRWRGEASGHVTVDPHGRAFVVHHGCHDRLHRAVVGNFDPIDALPGAPVDLFGGTKVDLALVGWAQLNVDGMTDRVHVDAPDGFDDDRVLRRFANVHRAGAVRMTFYPSLEERRCRHPERLRLRREGPRVPVVPPDRATGTTTSNDPVPGG